MTKRADRSPPPARRRVQRVVRAASILGRRRFRLAARGLRAEGSLYAAIAAGSVVGSVLRWGVSLALAAWPGGVLPWATLAVNVTGSFAIGFVAAITSPDGRIFVGPRLRQFAMTGVCGGYTTFSAFSLESVRLLRADQINVAAFYIALSIVTWIAAAWAGEALAERLNRLKGV